MEDGSAILDTAAAPAASAKHSAPPPMSSTPVIKIPRSLIHKLRTPPTGHGVNAPPVATADEVSPPPLPRVEQSHAAAAVAPAATTTDVAEDVGLTVAPPPPPPPPQRVEKRRAEAVVASDEERLHSVRRKVDNIAMLIRHIPMDEPPHVSGALHIGKELMCMENKEEVLEVFSERHKCLYGIVVQLVWPHIQ